MIPLTFYYIRWHYSMAIRDLVGIIGNFFWFFYELFSIPLFLKTFFVPFHRLAEPATKAFKPGVWFENFIVNSLMRIVGAALRTLLIFIGVCLLAVTGIVGALVLITWILAPLMLTFLIASGVTLIAAG
jgi:hypothetical protein